MSDGHLLIDFDRNRESAAKANLPCSAGLEAQLKRMGVDDYATFAWSLCKEKLDVSMSMAGLDCAPRESKGDVFYNNCILRTPRGDRDLVLLGDIYERRRTADGATAITRIYNPRAALLMDRAPPPPGDLRLTVSAVVRLNGEWTDCQGNYSSKPDAWNADNALGGDAMAKLAGARTVEDPAEALARIGRWEEYLRTRRYVVKMDSDTGYDVAGRPEFVAACANAKGGRGRDDMARLCESTDRLPHLDPRDYVYTAEAYDAESGERKPLVRIAVELPLPEYRSHEGEGRDGRGGNRFRRQLDSFTRAPCVLSAAAADDGRRGAPKLRLQDCRVDVCQEEIVEPEGELRAIEEERGRDIELAKKRSEEKLEADAGRLLDAYAGRELPARMDSFVQERRPLAAERVRQRAEARAAELEGSIGSAKREIGSLEAGIRARQAAPSAGGAGGAEKKGGSGRADGALRGLEEKLKAAGAELSALEAELEALQSEDRRALEDRELSAMAAAERKRLLREAEADIRRELEPERGRLLAQEIGRIEAMAGMRAEEAKRERSIVRLHTYFEIESDGGRKVDERLAKLRSDFGEGCRLLKDTWGEQTVLSRCESALQSLKDGSATNPYLAASLFSPEKAAGAAPAELGPEKLSGLNESQRKAVAKAVSSSGLFLIQGPPGTGKTQVIAKIAEILVGEGKKVLIASENNKAVDNALSRLDESPGIRAVRLIRDQSKREANRYAPERLVANFYGSISRSLRREIERQGNRERFAEEMDGLIGSLGAHLGRMKELESAAAAASGRISEADAESERLRKEVEGIAEENVEIDSTIDRLRGEADELNGFGGSEFARIAGEVGGRFGLEPDSVEYRELATLLCGLDLRGLMERYAFCMEHRELLDLYAEKAAVPDGGQGEIIELNARIKALEGREGVSGKDLSLLMHLPRGATPEVGELNAFRQDLKRAVGRRTAELDDEIAKWRSMRHDASAAESEIRALNARIDSLRNDPAYSELEKEAAEFNELKNTVIRDLKLSGCPPRPEDALRFIRAELERENDALQADAEGMRSRMDAYRRIARYVEDETVVENDGPRYLRALFENVNVIGITCTADARTGREDPYSMDLGNLGIDTVIIDEVSKVPFVQLLPPILLGKNAILVGDHKQLPPMYSGVPDDEIAKYDGVVTKEGEEGFRKMYETSFFDELFRRSPECAKETLTVQYRMHPDIMEIDNVFYGGALTFGGNPLEKEHRLTVRGADGRTIIGPGRHVLFVNANGPERKESGSSSYSNEEEAEVVAALLARMDGGCRLDGDGGRLSAPAKGERDRRLSVGVICMYADQTRLVRKKIGRRRFDSFGDDPGERFMVKSVDDFQGDERDVIILSLVRSRFSPFIAKFNRINVAISRARRLLVIVGNASVLEKVHVDIDGRRRLVYKDMILAIRRRNGFLGSADVLGGCRRCPPSGFRCRC